MKKLELLFPEFCNIYGESYSAEYLSRCSSEIELIETNHRDVPAFVTEDVDMIYLGCSPERKQEQIIEILMPYKERISQLIESSTIFLITGNAIEIFGNEICDGERTIPCLGLFDFYAERHMNAERHNSQYVGTFTLPNGEEMTMLGHRSQFSFSYGTFDEPFVNINIGIGMNPDTKAEGIHRNNFFATYSLGPYLIMNPLFAKHLLSLMGISDSLCFEAEAIEAYEYRRAELIANLG